MAGLERFDKRLWPGLVDTFSCHHSLEEFILLISLTPTQFLENKRSQMQLIFDERAEDKQLRPRISAQRPSGTRWNYESNTAEAKQVLSGKYFGESFHRLLLLSVVSLTVADVPFVPCLAPEGELLPHVTDCKNQLTEAKCDSLFPPTPGSVAANCFKEQFYSSSSKCQLNCLTCCRIPEYNCYDNPSSPLNCSSVSCTSSFQDALIRYCPATCGLCRLTPEGKNTCTDDSPHCEDLKPACQLHADVRKKCRMTCGVCEAPKCRHCLEHQITLTSSGPGGKLFEHDIIDERGICKTRTLVCLGRDATIEWNGGSRGVTQGINGMALETLRCAHDGSGWQIPPEHTIITRAECSATGPLPP